MTCNISAFMHLGLFLTSIYNSQKKNKTIFLVHILRVSIIIAWPSPLLHISIQ